MRNCCGPFKRGKPAKAVNPNQQCFADCCGNLCPPDGCCDTVKVEYQCGCGCECEHKGFNFSGLKFKRKRKKKASIPKFSKKTLAANGFTFADGTIPTAPPSSSSSSSSDCCDWDGKTYIKFPSECGGFKEDLQFDKIGPNEWYGSGSLICGDYYRATITCDPDVEYDGPESCMKKWSLSLSIDCAEGLRVLDEMLEVCSCNAPQVWPFTADMSGCVCCAPPSSSSSSSSSCECNTINVELTTTGCCLYITPNRIEAVGPGTITASSSENPIPGCAIEVILNGEARNEIEVIDGDVIDLSVRTSGDCECCETQRDCTAESAGLWLQKSNKDRTTVALDKKAIRDRVRLAVDRVRKRRRG